MGSKLKQKFNLLTLFFIVVIGFLLRVYKLDKIPPSLYWDEAAMALDAKSISLTGKDQHGHSWIQPIYPSWGDYKLPVYIITAVPFFKIASNIELAIRLPSAIAGTLTIIIVYFFVKELIKTINNEAQQGANYIALIASLLLATSPWHLQFSRAAFEGNLALMFNLTAILFFLRGINNLKWWILSCTCTILGIYTYYSARIILPIILVFSFFLFFRLRLKSIISFIIFSLIIGLCYLPLKYSSLAPKAEQFRLSAKNILTDNQIINYSATLLEQDNDSLLSRKIHNRYIYQAKELIDHYSKHLSLDFLLLTGDNNLRHSTTKIGELLLITLIGFLYGLYKLFTLSKKILIFFCAAILVCLLPAAATYEIPHALRSLNAVVFFNVAAAFGLYYLIRLFIKNKYKNWLIGGILFLFSVQLFFYLFDYYHHYSNRSYFAWQGGYTDAVGLVNKEINNTSNIVFTDYYARPYIYYLLYGNYPIQKFQSMRQNMLQQKPDDYLETTNIDKIQFRKPTLVDQQLEKVLIISAPQELTGDGVNKLNNAFNVWKNF